MTDNVQGNAGGSASGGKTNWIVIAVLVVVGFGALSTCQKQQFMDGVNQGADKAWQQCLDQGFPRQKCDCVSSQARTRANSWSVDEAKNMSRADIEALNQEIKRSCGIS